MSKTEKTKSASAWDEPATSRQKDRIRAYGWEITAYRKAQEEENRKEDEMMRREYERDQAQDEAEFRKMFKPKSKGCLLAFLVPFASAGGILAAIYLI